MKIFVSQPMRGKSREEIEIARTEALEKFRTEFPDNDYEIIDSILNIEEPHTPLYCLGRSLELLSTADLILMLPGWSKTRGCVIEYICASQYGITICNQDNNLSAESVVMSLVNAIDDDIHDNSSDMDELIRTNKRAALDVLSKCCDNLSTITEPAHSSGNIYSALSELFDELKEATEAAQ